MHRFTKPARLNPPGVRIPLSPLSYLILPFCGLGDSQRDCLIQCCLIGFCGCSQRDIMIHYTLDKNLSGEIILKDITNLLAKFPQDELKNMILTISLQKSPLPKISYENNSLT